jgi:hypothetical protein
MLTPARIREYTAPHAALDLLRDLGYPVAPVDVDPEEWRRGGVSIPWNGEARLQLAARLQFFDVFVLSGQCSEDRLAEFMRSYAAYNIATKSVVVYAHDRELTVFDLSAERALRRLRVSLDAASVQAVDRLNLLACPAVERGRLMARIVDRALDRESVTREFFVRFRSAVRDVADALEAQFPAEAREHVDAEALLLLSRLLFLSFIGEKGWLRGERRFLVDRLEEEKRHGREFFSGVLLPLFFGCLNTPLSERTERARTLGRIPYLNGGLFERSSFEHRHREIHLPNDLMTRVIEGVFEKFDFRIDEGDTAGTHVDPEMLGKVFESLMADGERAASGSFYTPKAVVDLLMERAIRTWLGDGGVERLSKITVLDPACGSGAFLLSALHVIEKIWRSAGDAPRDLRRRIVADSLYGVDLKPEAVRLCELRLWLAIVSGSDAAIEDVEPLPNLDRNILQGNSLLSPTDFLGDARTDLYAEWLHALRAQRELLERYRTGSHVERPSLYRLIRGNDRRLASELVRKCLEGAERELQHACAPQRDLFGRAMPVDAEACRTLRERVAELRSTLEKVEDGALDFFSFDVHFAHVMARGGFDIVAGNPPWVRHNRIEPRMRRMLIDRYPLFRAQRNGTAFHQPDLSLAFLERGTKLVAADGVLSMLMPSKITNAGYAGTLRASLRDRVIAIDDWSDDPRRKRWFAADTFPLALTLGRHANDVDIQAGGERFTLRRAALSVNGPSSEWALVPPAVAEILARLRARFAPLEEVLGRRPIMGVKTGDNASFFLENAELRGASLVTRDELRIPLSAVCRCVRGRDLRRWRVDASQWMLWPPPGGWRRPPAWLERYAEARGCDVASFTLSFLRAEHIGIKVAWKDLSRGMAAAVLPDVVHVAERAFPLVPNQTLYSLDAVSLDEAYVVAAVMNSTVAGALIAAIAERAKDSHFRYFGRTIAALPWPATGSRVNDLVRLSRRAHRGVDVEGAIDEIVAELYAVTSRELTALRGFLARRLGAR